MSDRTEATVLGSLPHARPERRSAKRGARPEQAAGAQQTAPAKQMAARETKATPKAAATRKTKATRKPTAARPRASRKSGAEATERSRAASAAQPEPEAQPGQRPPCPSALSGGTELMSTVVKASVELAEIGLAVGARALRIALSRLPRP